MNRGSFSKQAALILVVGWVLSLGVVANSGRNDQTFEGDGVQLTASGSAVDTGTAVYAWDLNNDGSFETPGDTVWFDASAIDGPASRIVNLQVCIDDSDICATDTATIDIYNVAPVIDPIPTVTVYSGDTYVLSATFTDPGVGDTFTATVNYDNGSSPSSATVSGNTVTNSHRYLYTTTRAAELCVRDDDGDRTCASFTVNVLPAPVNIDIKPYYNPNSINLESTDPLQVAILGSATLSASNVDPSSVTLAGAPYWSAYGYWYSDVNADGRSDLIVSVPITSMVVTSTATSATLYAATFDGVRLTGTDSIAIVQPRAPTPSTSTYPTITWGPVNGGVCYQIEIDDNSDFSSPAQISTIVLGTEYNAFPLTSGTYYWHVRVGGKCINVVQGGWSATRTLTVP